MAGKTAILTVKILGEAKDALKALGDTSDKVGGMQGAVQKAAVPAAAALAGLGAAGLHAAQAAAEDAAAADQLALALRNSAGASDKSIANTEAWITKTSKAAAVADDELRPALGTLVRATGDVGDAQSLMGTALDVSAATGKDVGSVSDALAKAYAGQTTSLKKLVPGIDDAVLASGDMQAIQDELARTTGGAAATAAESAQGQWKGFQIALGEAEETIGGALLPAFSQLGSVLGVVADWIGQNTTLFLVIGGIIAALATTIIVLNAAYKAYAVVSKIMKLATDQQTIAQLKLNLAFLTSPITWIILGIIALIAVIVLIATKTTWFQDIWAAVWGFIVGIAEAAWSGIVAGATAALNWLVSIWESLKAAVQAVWTWIQNAIQVVLVVIVNIIRAYIGIYVSIWEGIKAAVGAVWNWISGIVNTALGVIKGYVQTTMDSIVRIWEGIKSAIGAVWDWLKSTATRTLDAILGPINAIKSAFDNVVSAIRSVIDWLGKIKLPDAVAGIAGAIGGLFSVPAPPPTSGAAVSTGPAVRGLGAAPGLSSTASSAGGVTIVVQGALDPVGVARQIRQILTADDRRRSGVVIA